MVLFKKSDKLFGFTLAEVLLTLVVIGIIAAITVPLFMESFQKNITCEKLKKAYSVLSGAIAKASVDNGSPEQWEWTEHYDSGVTPTAWLNKYMLPYLIIAKKNNNSNWLDVYKAKTFSGVEDDVRINYYLSDGTGLGFHGGAADWNDDPWVWITVDINGKKSPNIYGKDIFNLFFYAKKGFQSARWVSWHAPYKNFKRDEVIQDCKTNGLISTFCTDLIQSNSWKIPKDYPW